MSMIVALLSAFLAIIMPDLHRAGTNVPATGYRRVPSDGQAEYRFSPRRHWFPPFRRTDRSIAGRAGDESILAAKWLPIH